MVLFALCLFLLTTTCVHGQIANCTGLLSGCGTSKSCFISPSGCCDNCNIAATWYASGTDDVIFEMAGNSFGWVGVGFSGTRKMEGGEALTCMQPNILKHYNMGHHSVSASGVTSGFTLESSSYANGYIRCKFTRQKNPGNGLKDLNQPWYMLYATGPQTGGEIKEHNKYYSSAQKVDVSKVQKLGQTGEPVHPLTKAHGCFMCIAWLGPAVLGVFFARYMKTAFGEGKLFGVKIWFQSHRGTMLFTVLFTLVGAILIFQKEHWEFDGDTHQVIGLIVIILTFLQPVLALFRPDPNHGRRWMFNWGHRLIGISSLILAIVAIFLGFNMEEMSIGAKGNATLGVYLFCIFIVAAFLEYLDYSEIQLSYEARAMSNVIAQVASVDHHAMEKRKRFQKFRKLLLLALTGLSTIAMIMTVVFVATAQTGGGGDDSDGESSGEEDD